MEDVALKDKIWLNARNILRKRLGDDNYNRWIRSIKPLSYDDFFVLGVPDEFFASLLIDNYNEDIEDALRQSSGEQNIKFKCKADCSSSEDTEAEKIKVEVARPVTGSVIQSCNPRFTFDSFVVGDGNNFAYSAAIAVSQSPGYSFNPLFIYGGTGLGKTHLAQAAAHEAVKSRKNFIGEYLTCEEFVNLYIEALRKNNPLEFRRRIRRVDMLIIDDVHFLSGKKEMQEEFFNTFNTLYNENKQIVLTSDRSPSEINGLESRLVSRFEFGLTTDIQPPSLELRMAILKKKQEEQVIKLDDEILYFIASKITSNIRRLEGALIRLTAFSSMTNKRITIKDAEHILLPVITQEMASKVTVDMIQKKVAEFYDLRVNDLLSERRPKNVAYPRMIAMYLSREMTANSLPEIGEAFGGRTHATVINAINKIKKERAADKNIDNTISLIQRQLQNH